MVNEYEYKTLNYDFSFDISTAKRDDLDTLQETKKQVQF